MTTATKLAAALTAATNPNTTAEHQEKVKAGWEVFIASQAEEEEAAREASFQEAQARRAALSQEEARRRGAIVGLLAGVTTDPRVHFALTFVHRGLDRTTFEAADAASAEAWHWAERHWEWVGEVEDNLITLSEMGGDYTPSESSWEDLKQKKASALRDEAVAWAAQAVEEYLRGEDPSGAANRALSLEVEWQERKELERLMQQE